MPIYEFYSPDTLKIYSFYSRSLSNSDKLPRCPDGKHLKMLKILSSFSITGKTAESDQVELENNSGSDMDPFSNLSESQSAHVMKEMEKAMSSMDDENPDPRQMGAMMRKMCEMTGEKIDGVMEEVVRKLEEGHSPDELEEKLGTSMEDGDEYNDHPDVKLSSEQRKNRKRIRLTRDPELYEMEDFLS